MSYLRLPWLKLTWTNFWLSNFYLYSNKIWPPLATRSRGSGDFPFQFVSQGEDDEEGEEGEKRRWQEEEMDGSVWRLLGAERKWEPERGKKKTEIRSGGRLLQCQLLLGSRERPGTFWQWRHLKSIQIKPYNWHKQRRGNTKNDLAVCVFAEPVEKRKEGRVSFCKARPEDVRVFV